ncbi:MAG: acetyltransferase [Ferruginibacter sp.]|nr:acetyltransferase [Ferruginibacter sp.]
MLIIGAKGLAKEVLQIFHEKDEVDNLLFYDDISTDVPDKLYQQFIVIRNMDDAALLFKTDPRFIIAVGMPDLRFGLYKQFTAIGGQLVSAISRYARVGNYGTSIAAGSIVMAGTVITNEVIIGKACLINPNCTISHDTVIGDFVDLSPGVQVTGHCAIGNYCNIGTNAIIIPKIIIGNRVTVGAGAVVLKNVEDGLEVAGVPAKKINLGKE